MITVKLQWHLNTEHLDFKARCITFHECKCDKLKHSELNLVSVRSEVLMVMSIKIFVFWDVTLCSLADTD